MAEKERNFVCPKCNCTDIKVISLNESKIKFKVIFYIFISIAVFLFLTSFGFILKASSLRNVSDLTVNYTNAIIKGSLLELQSFIMVIYAILFAIIAFLALFSESYLKKVSEIKIENEKKKILFGSFCIGTLVISIGLFLTNFILKIIAISDLNPNNFLLFYFVCFIKYESLNADFADLSFKIFCYNYYGYLSFFFLILSQFAYLPFKKYNYKEKDFGLCLNCGKKWRV